MIQPNELRIGNLVIHLDTNSVEAVFYLSSSLQRKSVNGLLPERYAPIPLTPDILEKLGFVSNRKNSSIYHLYVRNNRFDEAITIALTMDGYNVVVIGFKKETHAIPKPIRHLHQLQNLYFALTGEELDVSKIV